MTKKTTGLLSMPDPPAEGGALPQRARVYRAVLEGIRRGVLLPGVRLPSARAMAQDWGVTRSAVDEAFEQLKIEGLLERRVGDGTYVSTPTRPRERNRPAKVRAPSPQALRVLERHAIFMGKPHHTELPVKVLAPEPLFPRTPMTADFPLDIWRRLVTRAHGEAYRHMLTYGPAAGLPQMRESIARHLALARGTDCRPEQVLVLNSPMQAIELIARVLLQPGDAVWVEDPGHASMPPLLQALHLRPVPVPLDAEGLDVQAGQAAEPAPAAVYLHPLTQFPLGIRMNLRRRRALLEWADSSGAWIIEGNFNDEIGHNSSAPPSLQSLDRAERVLLMGTFEGIMYPALRLAYLVVPERLVDVFVAMRGLLGDHSSTAMQLALTWFIDEGHMSTHLRRLRAAERERRAVFAQGIRELLPAWARLGSLDAGTHACVYLPTALADVDVVRAVRRQGVLSFALSTISALPVKPASLNGLVLGYAAFEPAQISAALRTLGVVLRQLAAAANYQPEGTKT